MLKNKMSYLGLNRTFRNPLTNQSSVSPSLFHTIKHGLHRRRTKDSNNLVIQVYVNLLNSCMHK